MKANRLLVVGMIGALVIATVVAELVGGGSDSVTQEQAARPDPGRALSDRAAFWEGTGQVQAISRGFQFDGINDGVRIVIRRGADELGVLAGPEWYFEAEDFDIELSEELRIRGSMVTIDGEPVIFPSTIVKEDGQVLELRDEDGAPLWIS